MPGTPPPPHSRRSTANGSPLLGGAAAGTFLLLDDEDEVAALGAAESHSEEDEAAATELSGLLKFYLILMDIGVALEPFFAWFLYRAIQSAFSYFADGVGVEEDHPFMQSVNVLLIAAAVVNLVRDLTAINPTEDAYDTAQGQSFSQALTAAKLSVRRQKAAKGLYVAAQLLAVPLSFPVLAGADAVTIMQLAGRSLPGLIIGGAGSVVATAAGLAYYESLTAGAFQRHSIAYASITAQTFRKMLKSPLKSLEALFLAFNNAANRSIATGFIVSQILDIIFDYEGSNEIPLLVLAALSTLLVTLNSRALGPVDNLFNSSFEKLQPEHFARAKNPILEKIAQTFLALVRGVSAGGLVYALADWSSEARLAVSTIVGVLITLHTAKVNFEYADNLAALKVYQQSPEGLALLRGDPSSQSAFQKFQEDLQTPTLRGVATAVNIGALTARYVGFLGFIVGLHETLLSYDIDFGFNFAAIMALWNLSGPDIAKSDFCLYERIVLDCWTFQKVVLAMHEGELKGFVRDFWRNPNSYTAEDVQRGRAYLADQALKPGILTRCRLALSCQSSHGADLEANGGGVQLVKETPVDRYGPGNYF